MASDHSISACVSPGMMASLMALPTSCGTLTLATVHSSPTTTPTVTPTHWSRRVPRISRQPSRVVTGERR